MGWAAVMGGRVMMGWAALMRVGVGFRAGRRDVRIPVVVDD